MLEDLKGFHRILSYRGGGAVYVDTETPGWYCGEKRKPGNIYLASYRGGDVTRLITDILREYRDEIPVRLYREKRTPYERQLIEWLFDTLVPEIKKEYPRIKIEGGKYARNRYEC